jgi:hypothetical protein
MSAETEETRAIAAAIVVVMKMMLTTMAAALAVAMRMAVVTLAAAAGMVMVEARAGARLTATAMATAAARATATAMATAVVLAAEGGGCHSKEGLTIRYVILLQSAELVAVGSNNNGNCTPTKSTIDRGNFDREVSPLLQCRRFSDNGRERARTPAVVQGPAAVVAVAGRGGTEDRAHMLQKPFLMSEQPAIIDNSCTMENLISSKIRITQWIG